jgi:mycothiol synthase
VSRSDLDELESEPWFNAEDFLVLEHGDAMIGYCWLKVEAASIDSGTTGELYVVGVDPDRQGEGLGRRLVAAGLDRLDSRGIRTASLYVEGDNDPALALYRSVGFEEFAVDVQYSQSGQG